MRGNHVMEGYVASSTHAYPIRQGIPRLLPAQNFADAAFMQHQKKTGDSFAYEWNRIYQENPYERENFLHFLKPFLSTPDLRGKIIADIGCGSGRFTKQAAELGAALVVGSDIGESVVQAFERTKHLPNVCIAQADLYHMPLHHVADLVISIGVLHHLPDPQAGFSAILPAARPGGRVLIWVYNRRRNWRAVYLFESLRLLTRRLPKGVLYRLCYLPAAAVHAVNGLTHLAKRLKLPRLGESLPFAYYANFPFRMKLSDAFDVFATPKSNYYYVEEVETWHRLPALHQARCYEHREAGITCMSTYREP